MTVKEKAHTISQTHFTLIRPTVPAIELRDIQKRFGTFHAIDSLTLSVQQDEIFGLLGPNGSGKTTTINMISGLSAPTSGTVHVLGYDVQRQSGQVKRLLGCVPQETALHEELSAWHNMEYHAALYGVPRHERQKRIRAMLELVQLFDRKKSLVKTFSGGMKRRLALARALLHQPKVLYLDEPSLGVDVQSRHALYDFIRQLPSQGVTVLLTTNDMHEAEQLCSRVAIIDHGKLQALDTPQNLIKQMQSAETSINIVLDKADGNKELAEDLCRIPGVKQVIIEGECFALTTTDRQGSLGEILRLIVQRGRTVRDIAIQQMELEAVFLHVTGALLRD